MNETLFVLFLSLGLNVILFCLAVKMAASSSFYRDEAYWLRERRDEWQSYAMKLSKQLTQLQEQLQDEEEWKP